MVEHDRANLAAALNDLAPKGKTPVSARVLNAWITQAQDRLGSAGPRLGWLVAIVGKANLLVTNDSRAGFLTAPALVRQNITTVAPQHHDEPHSPHRSTLP